MKAVLRRACACGQRGGGGCEGCRKKTLRRSSHAAPPVRSAAPAAVHDVLSSRGSELAPDVRAPLERSFGHDFSQVRVHTDDRAADSARQVDALAYTVGDHVVFGRGQYRPGTPEGRRLLAHELAHTIQQSGASPPSSGGIEVGAPDDPQEREAEAAAAGRARPVPASAPRRLSRAQAAPSAEPGGHQTAQEDGIGPAEARRALARRIGEDRLRLLETAGAQPGEREAEGAAASAAAGGSARATRGSVAPGTLQRVHPAVVAGGVLTALAVCAYGFFTYAMDNYGHRGDKWKHCWTSCKIATYCGLPGGAHAFSLGIGALKEALDAICDATGNPCAAEWEDFVADAEGVLCAAQPWRSCVGCCDDARPGS